MAGITQPGGAGTTIFFEDNTAAPNGLYYRAQDFAAAFPADFVDLGTFGRKAYRGKVTVQNGDGAGVATTTWKDTRVDVYFDNTKTYLISSTGLANRYTEFGLLATSANGEPIGYDGCHLYCGANPFGAANAANFKLYDSSIENYNATAATSRVLLAPNVVGAVTDIVDTKVFTLAGTQAFGIGGITAGILGRARRINSIGLGAGIQGHIVQWNCPDADHINFYWPNGDKKLNTGGYVRIANPDFFGPSSGEDIRSTQATIMLNPNWSQNCIKYTQSSSFAEEWLELGCLFTKTDAYTPIQGVRVEIWDPFDKRWILDTYSNAQGTLDFLAPQSVGESPPFFPAGPFNTYPYAPFRNALMIFGHNNDGVMHEHYPFTMVINRGRVLGQYEEKVIKFTFPYSIFLTTEKQYKPLFLHIMLENEDEQKLSAAGADVIVTPRRRFV